ncbi:MAG: NifB/NifX family molybdenum-iron cluster-binding protein [Candidatus Methanomethylophilaceae archaeon]
MLFAIAYKDGEVFQHFGQTKEFKVFDSETGRSEILSSGQYSHGSLATLLEENGVEALICGGIGDGARNMLRSKGIAVYPGQTGNADDVAKAFMDGKVCDCGGSTCHHDHECHCH